MSKHKAAQDGSRAERDFDTIAASIHQGVFEQPYWAGFLAKIRRFAQADYASLVFRRADARYEDVVVIKSGSSDSSGESHEVQDLIRRSKLLYNSINPNTPYSLREILDFSEERNADYLAYLKSRSIDNALGMRVTEPEGGNCWLTLGRSHWDFGAGVRAAMARLAPHLSIAAHTLAELERERMHADVAADAVRRLNFGWVTFDAKARVVEIDRDTERLFRDTPGLSHSARGQILPLPAPAQHKLLGQIFDFVEKRSARPVAFRLVEEPCLEMLIVPILHRAVSGGVTPVAVGYVHGVGASSAARCEHLSQLFRLTRSEARLAVALSQGKTLAGAAVDMGLTIETARHYSKTIYAKTATHGQATWCVSFLAASLHLPRMPTRRAAFHMPWPGTCPAPEEREPARPGPFSNPRSQGMVGGMLQVANRRERAGGHGRAASRVSE